MNVSSILNKRWHAESKSPYIVQKVNDNQIFRTVSANLSGVSSLCS